MYAGFFVLYGDTDVVEEESEGAGKTGGEVVAMERRDMTRGKWWAIKKKRQKRRRKK